MNWHFQATLEPRRRQRAVEELCDRMEAAAPEGDWLWLVATATLRREVERGWARRPALFLRGRVVTLHQWAEEELALRGRPLRPLGEAARAWLVGRLVRELEAEGRAGPLAGRGERSRLAVALAGLLLELEEAAVEPEELEGLLRRVGAEVEREAAGRAPLPPEVLALLYARYRREAAAGGFRDGAAEYLLLARAARERGRPAARERGRPAPRHLVLDGFHDLTPAQAEALAAVLGEGAERPEEAFLLWCGDPADEADLAALESFRPLAEAGAGSFAAAEPAAPPSWRLLHPLDRRQEVAEALAWTVSGRETLLVARNPDLYGDELLRACRASGLPLPERQERLDLTPSGQALLGLGRARWAPGAPVAAALLRSGLWSPPGEPALLLAALAATGEALDGDWEGRLERRAETAEADPELRLLPWTELLEGWRQLRGRLAGALPEEGRPAELLAALLALAEELGAPGRLAAPVPEEAAERRREWEALRALQAELERVQGAERVDGPRFLERLGQALALERVVRPAEPGAPRLLHPSELRGLLAPHVLLLGLHEGGWPQAYHPDGLLGEAVRARLRRHGLRLESRESLRRRERFLFRLATAAGEEVSLSLPRFEGKDLLEPSSLLPAEGTERGGVAGGGASHAPGPLPFPSPFQAVVARGLGPGEASVARRRAAERGRRSARLDLWQGLLDGDPRLAGYLGARHAGGAHLDVTAVNSFLVCPFQYLVLHEWRLRSLPEPDQAFTPLEEGNLLHRLLAATLRPRLGQPLSALSDGAVREEAERRAEELLDEWERRALPPPAVLAGARQTLRRRLRDWLQAEAERARRGYDLVPEAVEVDLELRFPGPDGSTWQLPGRADRVDAADGRVVIYDYKRSQRDVRRALELEDVQLAAYALAWQQRERGATVLGAAWYNLRDLDLRHGLWREEAAPLVDLGQTRPGYLEPAAWQELMDRLPERLAYVGGEIQAGRFPVLPARDCPPDCAAREVCRVEPARLQAKRRWWEARGEVAAAGPAVDG
ncbi:MAG: PD-(D/E)XK nuclease family protein [Bacillota bacterium]|nr:PD-(D/E)XK nuclease family protein [Bacillota bacterium]